MKRSNRLVLLIGVFLAILAFVGIILLQGNDGDGGGGREEVITELPTVVAAADIPLGTRITKTKAKTGRRRRRGARRIPNGQMFGNHAGWHRL